MQGTFKILVDGQVKEYSNTDDIPETFDNMVSFVPDWPEGPHTEDEHAIMETFNDKLQELMQRETR